MLVRSWHFITVVVTTTACAQDPRSVYEDELSGSRWQVSFAQGQPFLGCNTYDACPQPAPKTATLPSGDVTGSEPGCTSELQITISDEAHAFVEQTWFGQMCDDGSTLDCSAGDSTNPLFCRWQRNRGLLDFCGGCSFDATLTRTD